MARYRNAVGVVVNIPEEKAERLGGLTPIEAPPSPVRKRRTRKAKPAPETTDEAVTADARSDDHDG